MLAYIKGTLEMKMTGYIVIDVGGLGYKIYMAEAGIEKLGETGKTVKVHTYYKVREDDISIYGFNTLEELRMFELLISVSGVGAKTALTMLATCTPTEFALAVITEDVKALTGIPGIGAKSAGRIILELKDKITKEQQIQSIQKEVESNNKTKAKTRKLDEPVETEDEQVEDKLQAVIQNNQKVAEAMAALQVLGYNKKEIEKAFTNLDKSELSTEELIKKGLNLLGK